MSVYDIDGVLADVRHRLHHLQRRPKNWDGFFGAAPADPVLPDGLRSAQEAAEDSTVIYVTGRPERCRQDTLDWLQRHGFPPGQLYMRPNRDRRPARFYKADMISELSRSQDVLKIVDDDDAVVEHLRSLGLPVEHATWMQEDQTQLDLLSQAQETEGRT